MPERVMLEEIPDFIGSFETPVSSICRVRAGPIVDATDYSYLFNFHTGLSIDRILQYQVALDRLVAGILDVIGLLPIITGITVRFHVDQVQRVVPISVGHNRI